jgi:hypothetical protein
MQYGGLKLINPGKYKNENGEFRIGFQPIYNMINSPGSELKILTYKSLKGMMFNLNVEEEEYIEYNGLNENSTQFTEPITNYVLKIVIISPIEKNLPDYKDINEDKYKKKTETTQSFFDECKLQQTVWEDSIRGGRPPICPSVANLVFFDNDNSKDILQNIFLKKLRTQPGDDYVMIESIEVIKYLLGQLQDTRNTLGIMTMPSVENALTLADFEEKNYATDPHSVIEALIYSAAQIIKLFFLCSLHFDLHSRNILVYKVKDKIKSLLIDFGNAANLEGSLNAFVHNELTRSEYLNKSSDLSEPFVHLMTRSLDRRPSHYEKEHFIKTAIDEIREIDKIQNQRVNVMPNPNAYQMDWIESLDPRYYVDVYDIVCELMRVNTDRQTMTSTTLNSYRSNKYLIDFYNKSPSDFMFPLPIQQCEEGMCTISGGKNKKSRNRKSRNRKSRKSINKKSINRKYRKSRK